MCSSLRPSKKSLHRALHMAGSASGICRPMPWSTFTFNQQDLRQVEHTSNSRTKFALRHPAFPAQSVNVLPLLSLPMRATEQLTLEVTFSHLTNIFRVRTLRVSDPVYFSQCVTGVPCIPPARACCVMLLCF